MVTINLDKFKLSIKIKDDIDIYIDIKDIIAVLLFLVGFFKIYPMPENKIENPSLIFSSVCLVMTVFFVWFWTNNSVLINYNLLLVSFLVVVYFLIRLFGKTKSPEIILEMVVLTASLLLILSYTGGLESPFFFLIYFLIFSVSFLFEPPITLLLTLTLMLFFAKSLTSLHAVLQLLSLLFITPLAIFFGKLYLRLLESREKIKILAKDKKLSLKKNQQLSSAIENEETNTLLWLSLNFKNNLLQIIHETTEMLADLSHLTLTQKEKLQKIHESAKELLKSGEKLREKIDKETDE